MAFFVEFGSCLKKATGRLWNAHVPDPGNEQILRKERQELCFSNQLVMSTQLALLSVFLSLFFLAHLSHLTDFITLRTNQRPPN